MLQISWTDISKEKGEAGLGSSHDYSPLGGPPMPLTFASIPVAFCSVSIGSRLGYVFPLSRLAELKKGYNS